MSWLTTKKSYSQISIYTWEEEKATYDYFKEMYLNTLFQSNKYESEKIIEIKKPVIYKKW
jgi:hypothetical protein